DLLRQVLSGGVYLPATMSDSVAAADVETAIYPQVPAQAPEAGSLTVRQIEVLGNLCQGKGNKEIAADFGLSEKTVKTHLSAIFKVLRVVNRTQAVLAARRLGLFVG
ncbi:MAG TPA: response regulator transcription factor, partial [Steroidobacteraceae bacterium]